MLLHFPSTTFTCFTLSNYLSNRRNGDSKDNDYSLLKNESLLVEGPVLISMPVSVSISMLKTNEATLLDAQEKINIYVMRHAERVDNLFENWTSKCVSPNGEYIRSDSNMPFYLPKREGSMESFRFDSPLTNIGAFQAKLIGESFTQANVNIRYAYSSPALRCIQTCHNVFLGSGKVNEVPIKIEPGLFEWVSLYADIYPSFMTKEELVNASYVIDENYHSLYSYNDMKTLLNETSEQYYQRGYNIISKIIKDVSQSGGGDVLLVAHGSSLDICSRLLIGSEARKSDVIGRLLYEVPYCGMIKMRRINNSWKIVHNDVLGVTHSPNKEFDFEVLHNFH